jgi:hypothetical protein
MVRKEGQQMHKTINYFQSNPDHILSFALAIAIVCLSFIGIAFVLWPRGLRIKTKSRDKCPLIIFDNSKMEAQGMNIECRTLLFQMLKNRPEGMDKKDCLLALSEPDLDEMLEEIRRDLFNKISEMTDEEYQLVCIESIKKHLEE